MTAFTGVRYLQLRMVSALTLAQCVESKMYRLVVACVIIALATLFTTTLTGCEPCDDPSQLWCPDEW